MQTHAAPNRRSNILAHRGYWLCPEEKNSLTAIKRAFQCGFGIETDVRDCGSRLVVSHDPYPSGERSPDLADLLDSYAESGVSSTLALNIKADGLCNDLLRLLATHNVANFFVFDMSFPEMFRYSKAEAPFFTRLSDLEPYPQFYSQAQGVWLDGFDSSWWTAPVIEECLSDGKTVAVVSPELHGRNWEPAWEELSKLPDSCWSKLLLCTDHPMKAAERFFYGN